FKQAAIMSAVWVSFALGFYVVLRIWGHELHNIEDFARLAEVTEKHLHNIRLIPDNFVASLELYRRNLALEYITGYVVEYALSVVNILVMVVIFCSFGVPAQYYHRVVVWGIIGAIVLRYLFIFLGAALISQFGWILYIFGLFRVFAGTMMFIHRNQEE